ncbi:hypothetical protein B0H19DRAFT_1124338 [Mycena capillaripes]|nr:hypothetical protein B0H19DRAFT_1124338 [Mycena capillaripes]
MRQDFESYLFGYLKPTCRAMEMQRGVEVHDVPYTEAARAVPADISTYLVETPQPSRRQSPDVSNCFIT